MAERGRHGAGRSFRPRCVRCAGCPQGTADRPGAAGAKAGTVANIQPRSSPFDVQWVSDDDSGSVLLAGRLEPCSRLLQSRTQKGGRVRSVAVAFLRRFARCAARKGDEYIYMSCVRSAAVPPAMTRAPFTAWPPSSTTNPASSSSTRSAPSIAASTASSSSTPSTATPTSTAASTPTTTSAWMSPIACSPTASTPPVATATSTTTAESRPTTSTSSTRPSCISPQRPPPAQLPRPGSTPRICWPRSSRHTRCADRLPRPAKSLAFPRKPPPSLRTVAPCMHDWRNVPGILRDAPPTAFPGQRRAGPPGPVPQGVSKTLTIVRSTSCATPPSNHGSPPIFFERPQPQRKGP